MGFTFQTTPSRLTEFCRALRIPLAVGTSPLTIFRSLGKKGSFTDWVPLIQARLEKGAALADALESEPGFPPLFLSMVRVGEETGRLPEVLETLEDFYHTQQQLIREVKTRSFLPLVQFGFAILILAGLIWILGVIGSSRGGPAVTLFGLSGASGALTLLAAVVLPGTALWILVVLLRRSSKSQEWAEGVLFRTPLVGPCLEALALTRLCLALRMTLDSSLSLERGLKLGFAATGFASWMEDAKAVLKGIKKGRSLTLSMSLCPRLPADFLEMLSVAEVGGRLPELLAHQAREYQEEAGRRMQRLARAATGALWLLYAGFMVLAIFSIAKIYLGSF